TDPQKSGFVLSQGGVSTRLNRKQVTMLLKDVLGFPVLKRASKSVRVVIEPDASSPNPETAEHRTLEPDTPFYKLTPFVQRFKSDYFADQNWHEKLLRLPMMSSRSKKHSSTSHHVTTS